MHADRWEATTLNLLSKADIANFPYSSRLDHDSWSEMNNYFALAFAFRAVRLSTITHQNSL
jgi:hypothetical protein